MKKVFAVILSALMLLSCASAMAEGAFRVGMECNYAPYNWTQAEPSEFTVPIEGGGGYADGYDVQIAKLIAEGLGKELVIVKTEWDGLPMGVMSGAFDAIIAGMSPTEERKATLDFSDPYRTNKLVVVVKKDSPYASATSLEELSGATITGQLNTFHYTVIDQIPGVNKAMAMETFPAMIVAVQSGAVDGYVAEEDGAQADTAANPDLTYIKFDEGKGFEASEADTSIAVGLAKGSDLLGPINEILAGIDDAAAMSSWPAPRSASPSISKPHGGTCRSRCVPFPCGFPMFQHQRSCPHVSITNHFFRLGRLYSGQVRHAVFKRRGRYAAGGHHRHGDRFRHRTAGGHSAHHPRRPA